MEKKAFNLPYSGIDDDMLIGPAGESSVIFRIQNPVTCFEGASAAYEDFHQLLFTILKTLGEGYILQKQDIIFPLTYPSRQANDYLQQKYYDHFAGRRYLKVESYLTFTRSSRNGSIQRHDPLVRKELTDAAAKVFSLLHAGGAAPCRLDAKAVNRLVLRVLAMQFDGPVTLNNFQPGEQQLLMGERHLRSVSLVGIEELDLPAELGCYTELNEKETLSGFPTDLLSFLFQVPETDAILFNQLVRVPDQAALLRKLAQKRNRHAGIPDAANQVCMADIDLLLNDVARDKRMLVYSHFNILVAAHSDNMARCMNFIEGALFQLGFIPSRNAYNQLELFRSALPGNGVELKSYDWFLTTAEAALCLYFKESLPTTESSDFLVSLTDRQGVPVGIDLADLPMRTNRINNRNKFVLGPSGSGKSFFMNALLQQYMDYPMDVVVVDTGHSYSGLCSYIGGRYITYGEQSPVSMNPFQMVEEEYTIEKADFIVTLVSLLWKGADGTVNPVERDLIAQVTREFFATAFLQPEPVLNYDSFFNFACLRLPRLREEEGVVFNCEEFRYVLRKFCSGGQYGTVLNQATDRSLFTERMIVFEIDVIKNHKILFPIVTLVIMDVFIQKMRHRSQRRKCLVVEEAWKAIASPMMAEYLLYLFKTIRKFWGEVIIVTQELGDVLGNPVVKDSIINNSDTICLLDQSRFRENYSSVAALLSISETEQKKIFTVNQLNNTAGRGRFKEVYIRRGLTGEVYGVEVSIEQYLCFSTEKPEKTAVLRYASRFCSYQKGIEAFVRDLNASGLSLNDFVRQVNLTQTEAQHIKAVQ